MMDGVSRKTRETTDRRSAIWFASRFAADWVRAYPAT
jgi:hypothetical protein